MAVVEPVILESGLSQPGMPEPYFMSRKQSIVNKRKSFAQKPSSNLSNVSLGPMPSRGSFDGSTPKMGKVQSILSRSSGGMSNFLGGLMSVSPGTMPIARRGGEEAALTEEASYRARQRWQNAKDRVCWALQKIDRAQRERQKFLEDIDQERTSQLRISQTHDAEEIVRDAASMVEIHQTVLTSLRSVYHRMFEAHSLGEYGYRTLLESLEMQEEAINGELRQSLYNEHDEDPDPSLRGLEQGSHQQQMDKCFAVAWAYIEKRLSMARKSSGCRKRNIGKRLWVQGEYMVMKRELEMVLAFVMTHETIVEEFKFLEDVSRVVKKPIMMTTERAKTTALFRLSKSDPAMFTLAEHVLCVRLMVDTQRHIVEEMVEEGALTEADANMVVATIIKPVLDALDQYVPTRDQLHFVSHPLGTKPNASMSLGPFFRHVRVRPAPSGASHLQAAIDFAGLNPPSGLGGAEKAAALQASSPPTAVESGTLAASGKRGIEVAFDELRSSGSDIEVLECGPMAGGGSQQRLSGDLTAAAAAAQQLRKAW